MLSLGTGQRYFLYAGVADMRKGFDGLSGLVLSEMNGNPLSGDVFIFVNRRKQSNEVAGVGPEWFCAVVQTAGARHL
jgi:transposase